MARQRTTFGKLQRDREKQARAQAKRERRIGSSTGRDREPAQSQADQEAVVNALTELHIAYDAGVISLEDFEAKREELRHSLHID